ncbi:response regulator receiver domain-containing protein [Mucilaginibacter yixingensis]|uniref:Response regulator receiver domain-containing protein n=1 Tax=Mucilaginibacter yixingensis TaxID=1295612 RepID=A0A2T5JEB7_9SPHI|nr:response regulator [Mucilaginibacter yixingensis]PTR00111.1 response regulator receiver domain-containing protein [Mucilaginibacter yixingensis]
MPKTILIAENDADILDIMGYILSDAGYRVLKSLGADALHLAFAALPDLLILDHRLEDSWGADICRQLKAAPLTSHIPVILMSATMHLEETARAAGADEFLTKPFDIDQLLSLVAGLFR